MLSRVMLLLLAFAALSSSNAYAARSDPWLAPLRDDDPRIMRGSSCDVSDARDRLLMSYGDERPWTALRIGGRLVRFWAEPGRSRAEDRFRGPAGRLLLTFVDIRGQGPEAGFDRAILTFTDRQGRARRASVRVACEA